MNIQAMMKQAQNLQKNMMRLFRLTLIFEL